MSLQRSKKYRKLELQVSNQFIYNMCCTDLTGLNELRVYCN